MSTSETAPSAGEYISHHLVNLSTANGPQKGMIDFANLNYDTVFFSIFTGVLGLFFLWKMSHKASAGVPGRAQAFMELLVELIGGQAQGIVHNKESLKFIKPLALTVFVWVFLMNSMDFFPVDLFPLIWQTVTGDPHAYMRVVPTADLNGTLGLSVGVLFLCFYYSIKVKGLGGWVHELFTAPFGNHPVLYPFNLIMQCIEFGAKTLSHGMRLWGNLYAGELIFMLIALLGMAFPFVPTGTGVGLFALHILLGSLWALFHILIVVLQAFIFMMLTLIYLGQAHEHH